MGLGKVETRAEQGGVVWSNRDGEGASSGITVEEKWPDQSSYWLSKESSLEAYNKTKTSSCPTSQETGVEEFCKAATPCPHMKQGDLGTHPHPHPPLPYADPPGKEILNMHVN